MIRQSISISKPNDEWLKALLSTEEYQSKSEIINDLIRHARKNQLELDFIRNKLKMAEESGFTTESKEQILEQSKLGNNQLG